jgi:phosphoglycolate phosphatase-like HAD superfamily hydrolase
MIAELFEAGAMEAVEILGMKPGEGALLELSIQEFRVEIAPPPFGLPNFISHGRVEAVLKSPEGEELARGTYPAASWETASKWEAVAAAFTKSAWEASARTLLSRFSGQPDPDAIQRVLASLDTNKDQRQRDYAVFWLGLVGRDNPAVAEKLFDLFRKEQEQSVRQSAAVALAMLLAPGAREQFEALLSGGQKLSQWDPRGDAEEAWHLLRGLWLLGVTDLGSKVPPIKRHRDKLEDLLRFQQTGEIPRMDPKDMAELTRKLEKKRKK